MTVILYVTLAIALAAISKLISKYVLKEVDAYSYSLFTNILAALLFFPLFLTNIEYTLSVGAFVTLGIACALWAIKSVVGNISVKSAELSVVEPLYQVRILFVLVLGIIFLGEPLTSLKIVGTLLFFLGIFFLFYDSKKGWHNLSWPGIMWTLGAAALAALLAFVDKFSLQYFSIETYGFLASLIPALILLFWYPKRKEDVSRLLRTKWKSAALSIILSIISYYFVLKTLSILPLSTAYPFLQLSTVITVFGAVFFLKERENMAKKIFATLVIVIGAVLLRFA